MIAEKKQFNHVHVEFAYIVLRNHTIIVDGRLRITKWRNFSCGLHRENYYQQIV